MDEMQRTTLVAVLNTSDISRNILGNLEKQLTTRVRQIVEDTVGRYHTSEIDVKFKEIGIADDTSRKDVLTFQNSITHTDEDVVRDCSDLPDGSRSGIYTIKPDHSQGIDVYCEMKIDEGGWTVIQRRENGYLDFYLGWEKSKEGFGDLNQEFWLGNDNIHSLTSQGRYQLRIDLYDFDFYNAYAKYQHFYVGDEESKYKLDVYGYSGTAGDSLASHNGVGFSTFNQDNDASIYNNAEEWHGGWWYKSNEIYSNLHGKYFFGEPDKFWEGLLWRTWKGNNYSLKSTIMMIRRM
ncbi:Fibrinogen-like protein A,Ryncolin-4,Ficolin-1-B,Techylectin-5A,Ficolin-2,Ryncolin-1,Tenascin-R,Fibrinogen-like protein 1,Angiopoietin-related protein 4,Angiopoietin-1,Fibrinogen C domain-containing protein 1-A,Tenascin-N,Ryncolin-3,Tenascin,Fibroleukin,Fibrinogen C domain-containing protein 1,Techylectin-like protein,Ryncolin-2,Techylectin-5B,Angiopoietin-related protein 2,Angiopoietin-2,Microfibril-associated glycoprotein 4,Fibrinogen alpha chain,Ficolin-1-A,Ficolin-1,Fibrinogen C domain-containing prote|uniref:Fibrinogen C-terminal domain-containing protein n=1 Tax=Mytilus coruscus TaxID=42192 RepID=A0A6J8CLI7_MYTCO|nr:Fibrinogen-like protein A,Ryncolin-4,Ficolin-1-B,Techylectin-5A,Ficolin-2,Ryncolin-1,Tenascin-R,Fibrinogen-like protein 1,Angiopoietin-related protein 4,Angiopoietin-1,Fibrinogen C domain-containing protein 1-A,Tenascin-N,Ryncolin-3,Tenascin,Fibroleukin,Fibrinogen C domain-containing protein 1,Techylectin-like protein,Ryncolin-2,Techylectin-5B,Angiopoietin-related protein 2,Angiopoietin-2,Microfibril-associated glycoprotein 4,Fibrinogen alpha chain,Ficolin-1-A,Ficolin-1,Fibrinogen C domain-conta